MIDMETVMPRIARQQTTSFTTVVRSLVEAEEAEASSTMKAIFLQSKTGAEGLQMTTSFLTFSLGQP
jgi:hypothetical protein